MITFSVEPQYHITSSSFHVVLEMKPEVGLKAPVFILCISCRGNTGV
jgi:hypothetical protein